MTLASSLQAAESPSAKLTGPKSVEVGSPIILNPTGTVAPDGLDFALAEGPDAAPVVALKSDDGSTVIGLATAGKAGTYRFVVTAWGKAEAAGKRPPHAFAFWTVQVGTPEPPPPPPAPSDPLWPALKASFSGSAADKAGAARLAAGYRQVANVTARDAALKSVGDFRAAAGTVIAAALPMPGLQACRQVVANDVTPQFGTNPGLLLDTSLRDKFAAAFTRYATLFEALSQ